MRYHLPHFRLARGFRSKVEVFNFYHFSLRSVIERAFGVYKARWRILKNMTHFKLETQMSIIWACFALYNYIKRMNSGDLCILESFEDLIAFEDRERNFNEENDDDICDQDEWQEPTQADVRYMEEIRDAIMDQLPR